MNVDQVNSLLKKYPTSVVNGLERTRMRESLDAVHTYMDSNDRPAKVNVHLHKGNTYNVAAVTSVGVKLISGISIKDEFGTEHVLVFVPFHQVELIK